MVWHGKDEVDGLAPVLNPSEQAISTLYVRQKQLRDEVAVLASKQKELARIDRVLAEWEKTLR